jgi:hypothetical protein
MGKGEACQFEWGSASCPFNPFILIDTRLADHGLERSDRLAPVREVYGDEPVQIVIPWFRPRLVRSSQFLIEAETVLCKKFRDLGVCPIVQSPWHSL